MAFAVGILRLIDSLPRRPGTDAVARQLARSGTSVGANYRAACNARSRAEFVAKLCIVVEEADESVFWLETVEQSQYVSGPEVTSLVREAVELRAIFARSLGTARANLAAGRSRERGRCRNVLKTSDAQ